MADSLPRFGDSHHAGVALDHMQPEALPASVAEAARAVGPIDVLVNNGHEPLAADWTTVTADQFTRQLANATGYFELARLVRDDAVRRGAAASVIMLGSMYGVVGSYPDAYAGVSPASSVAYHASKGASCR